MNAADERQKREHLARIYLWVLSSMLFIAACTATGTYAYPVTLEAIQGGMVFVHDASGDIAIVVSILYLYNHLSRTWRMKKAYVSRYTGIAVVTLWTVAAVTGIYGHFYPLDDRTPMWWAHFVTSVAVVLGVIFHGLWAYRPKKPVEA